MGLRHKTLKPDIVPSIGMLSLCLSVFSSRTSTPLLAESSRGNDPLLHLLLNSIYRLNSSVILRVWMFCTS